MPKRLLVLPQIELPQHRGPSDVMPPAIQLVSVNVTFRNANGMPDDTPMNILCHDYQIIEEIELVHDALGMGEQ